MAETISIASLVQAATLVVLLNPSLVLSATTSTLAPYRNTTSPIITSSTIKSSTIKSSAITSPAITSAPATTGGPGCSQPEGFKLVNIDSPDTFYSGNENGTDPAWFDNLGSGCNACCYYREIWDQTWGWSYLSPSAVVVGTAVVVVDPKSNRTSTTTILHTTSAVLSLNGGGNMSYAPSNWQQNGTFAPSTATAPKTGYFVDLNGRNTSVVFPTQTTQIVPHQYWIGRFPVTEAGTTTCIENDGGASEIPSPAHPPPNKVIPTESSDPYGVWYGFRRLGPHFVDTDEVVSQFSSQLIQSVYETCKPPPSVMAAETTVAIASFLLETSTSTGSVAAAPTPTFTTPVTKETADPLTASQSPSPTATLPLPETSQNTASSGPTPGEPTTKETAVEVTESPTGTVTLPVTVTSQQTAASPNGNTPPAPTSSPIVQTQEAPSPVTTQTSANASPSAQSPVVPATSSTSEGIGGIIYSALVGSSTPQSSATSAAPTNAPSASNSVTQPTNSPLPVVESPAVASSSAAAAASNQPAPITVAGSTITANAETQYVVGSATISPGGNAVTISGSTYALASSATALLVNGVTTPISQPASSAAEQPAPIVVAGSTVSANSASQYAIGSETLAPGQAAITVSGTTYSLASAGTAVVVNGVTTPLPPTSGSSQGAVQPVITIGGSTVSANSASQYAIGSETLVPGQAAITVSGTTYSLASAGTALVVNGVTTPLSPTLGPSQGAAQPVITVAGSTITANSASEYVVGSATLVPGGSALTISGSTYSLGQSGTAIIVNGQTSAIAVPVGAPITLGGGLQATPITSGVYALPGNDGTLSAGGPAVTVSGTTYSLDSSGSSIVVNGVTSALATAMATPTAIVVNGVTTPVTFGAGHSSLTIVGSTVTANSDGVFVVGSETLSPGGVITVSGSTYSLQGTATSATGASGSGSGSTTSAAVTGNVVPQSTSSAPKIQRNGLVVMTMLAAIMGGLFIA